MLPVKYNSHFLRQLNLVGIIGLSQSGGKSCYPQFFVYCHILNISVCRSVMMVEDVRLLRLTGQDVCGLCLGNVMSCSMAIGFL